MSSLLLIDSKSDNCSIREANSSSPASLNKRKLSKLSAGREQLIGEQSELGKHSELSSRSQKSSRAAEATSAKVNSYSSGGKLRTLIMVRRKLSTGSSTSQQSTGDGQRWPLQKRLVKRRRNGTTLRHLLVQPAQSVARCAPARRFGQSGGRHRRNLSQTMSLESNDDDFDQLSESDEGSESSETEQLNALCSGCQSVSLMWPSRAAVQQLDSWPEVADSMR